MPLLVEVTAQCRECRALHDLQAPIATDATRTLLAIDRYAVYRHLEDAGWKRCEFAPSGKTAWADGTGVFDWLCASCATKANAT